MPSRVASGRFVLRLPSDLHGRLRRIASARGTSLNALCAAILNQATEATQVTQPAVLDDVPGWRELVRGFSELQGERLLGVVLFGSAARGELRAGSDIDLLLVLPAHLPLRRQLYRQWDELSAHGSAAREINAHFVHLPRSLDEAGSLWLEVAVEGRVLEDSKGMLQPVLVDLRRAIAAGRFIRSTSHGQPYWRRAA